MYWYTTHSYKLLILQPAARIRASEALSQKEKKKKREAVEPITENQMGYDQCTGNNLKKSNRIQEVPTLQIASISSKMITCSSLWSPGNTKTTDYNNKFKPQHLHFHDSSLTFGSLVLLSISKQIPHIFFCFTDELA